MKISQALKFKMVESMNKLFLPITSILYLLFLVSCVNQVEKTEFILETKLTMSEDTRVPVYPKPTKLSIPMLTPTINPTTKIITQNTTATSSVIPGTEVTNIEVETSDIDWGQAEGVLLLLDWDARQEIILDLATGERKPIDPNNPQNAGCNFISPDRKRVACHPIKGNLTIWDNQWRIVNRTFWKDNWYMIYGWINNDQLLLLPESADYIEPFENLPTIFYNPFTLSEKTIRNNYPGIESLYGYYDLGQMQYTGTCYSPTLGYVIYKEVISGEGFIVLWDRHNNQKITQVIEADLAYPQWSPDGQQVVVTGLNKSLSGEQEDDELFILSESSGAKQFTYLGKIFQEEVVIYSTGWSPDGRRISFDFLSKKSPCAAGCIGVLDLRTSVLQLFRFPNYHTALINFPTYAITWSPDSQQLLLSLNTINSEKPSIILFDIDRQVAYEVAKNSRINGWMISP